MDPATVNPFEIKRIVLYEPPQIAERMVSQRSIFTVEPDSSPDGKGPGVGDVDHWHVAAESIAAIKEELLRLAIGPSTLFPGLDSISRELKARMY